MILLKEFYTIIISNILFSYILGIDVVSESKRRKKNIFVVSLTIMIYTVACCLVQYLSNGIIPAYLRPVINLLVILILFGLGYVLFLVFSQNNIKSYRKYALFGAFNSATAGIIEYTVDMGTLKGYLFYSVELSIGFLIAFWLLSVVYEHFYSSSIPSKFRGYPALLVFTGLLSMAVYCFEN